MQVVTMISDWGDFGFYLPSVKGGLLSLIPSVQIVDITHKIRPFDTGKAAYALRKAYPSFPKNTIHIVGVDTICSADKAHVVVKHKGQYFIGADNGIFALLFGDEPKEVWKIMCKEKPEQYTFPCRDIFPEVAAKIYAGVDMSEIGEPFTLKTKVLSKQPATGVDYIRGRVVCFDSYDNAITDIHLDLFYSYFQKYNKFQIQLKTDVIKEISFSYESVGEGDLVALFDSDRYLQIAVNGGGSFELGGGGGVASLLGVSEDEIVYIKFMDLKS